MKIVWNPVFKQFETHARTSSLGSDVEALKAAGWKTEGPPDWLWVAFRPDALTKLKTAVPSGITITPDALENFRRLKQQVDKNAEIKAALKAHRKEVGKIENPSTGFRFEVGPEGFKIAVVESGESKIWNKYIPSGPAGQCHVCQSSIYGFEKQDPPTCLDCEFDPGL